MGFDRGLEALKPPGTVVQPGYGACEHPERIWVVLLGLLRWECASQKVTLIYARVQGGVDGLLLASCRGDNGRTAVWDVVRTDDPITVSRPSPPI